MFIQPEDYPNLSLILSQVLDDIGVNETMIMKRRRAWMLAEILYSTLFQLIPDFRGIVINFGSQTEGSTTQGLNSDIDKLSCYFNFRIIQDWSEWKHLHKTTQFMMVQDESTSPGYCLLQLTQPDAPLPAQYFPHEDFTIDNRGRVLLRHSFVFKYYGNKDLRHGPAKTVLQGFGRKDMDNVFAFHCSSWPKEADPWLHQQNVSGWPTEEMKKYSAEQGCFVVPVSSRTCVEEYQDLEWRISTSLAERCLMFNINITQMRCYILMKMILKTFLKPICEEAISSFMCKNILFHCIAESENSSTWNDSSLLTWLNKCLQSLFNCIRTDCCPHFMIPSNNLLAGKLSADVKHQLVDFMCDLTEITWHLLLGIQIDDLGNRILIKSGGIPYCPLKSVNDISNMSVYINVEVAYNLLILIRIFHQCLPGNFASAYQMLTDHVFKFCQVYGNGNTAEQVAFSLYEPFLCSLIGCVIASEDIQLGQVLSAKALIWLTVGLNSDISSGKVKLASALYCAGDLVTCEIILDSLRIHLSQTPVLTFCCCNSDKEVRMSKDLKTAFYEKNVEDVIKHNMSFCVTYLPCEFNCVPNELKFEMFRSTALDRLYRGECDNWMDWAVVDSKPYLYFLEYKVYTQLHRPAEQQQALDNLIRTIDTDEELGHRETALNLLGQCMKQEERMNAALCCYMMSLKVRRRNNAAKWHICRLLACVCKSRSK